MEERDDASPFSCSLPFSCPPPPPDHKWCVFLKQSTGLYTQPPRCPLHMEDIIASDRLLLHEFPLIPFCQHLCLAPIITSTGSEFH